MVGATFLTTKVGARVCHSRMFAIRVRWDATRAYVVLAGVTTKVRVAHVRLCHSRMFLVGAYPRESQEMVFDAHDRASAPADGASTTT